MGGSEGGVGAAGRKAKVQGSRWEGAGGVDGREQVGQVGGRRSSGEEAGGR